MYVLDFIRTVIELAVNRRLGDNLTVDVYVDLSGRGFVDQDGEPVEVLDGLAISEVKLTGTRDCVLTICANGRR